ncbi:hypothetical protein IGI04_002079, partial [Brassica rapa subsp. trilocularis]
GLQSPDHISSDLLHYADDPRGHAVSQPCLAAQCQCLRWNVDRCWVGMGGRQKSSLGRRWKMNFRIWKEKCMFLVAFGTTGHAPEKKRKSYLSPDLRPHLSLVGPEKVSIDSNNRVSIDTPFSPLIDATSELSNDVPSREH